MSDLDLDLTRGIYRRIYAGATKGKRINAVSLLAEVLFWRLHLVADDFGRFEADPYLLHCAALPRRRSISESDIAGALAELEGENLVVRYEVSGEPYGLIRDFEEMQPAGKNGRRIQRYPSPPGESRGIRVNPGEPKKSKPSDNDNDNQNENPDENDMHACSEPAKPASPPEAEGVVLTFACDGPVKVWELNQAKVNEWSEAFPHLNVMGELRKARQWLRDNPSKRKTASGMPRFLGAWLSRAQNRGGAKPYNPMDACDRVLDLEADKFLFEDDPTATSPARTNEHTRRRTAERGEFPEPEHDVRVIS